MLPKIFTAASKYSLCSRRFAVSREKVEKVVKPPKSPVVRKGSQNGAAASYLVAHCVIAPISTAPRIFMIKVPSGNVSAQK